MIYALKRHDRIEITADCLCYAILYSGCANNPINTLTLIQDEFFPHYEIPLSPGDVLKITKLSSGYVEFKILACQQIPELINRDVWVERICLRHLIGNIIYWKSVHWGISTVTNRHGLFLDDIPLATEEPVKGGYLYIFTANIPVVNSKHKIRAKILNMALKASGLTR